MKDYCAALEPLYEAIRLNPQPSDARYNLAVAQAQLGEKLRALDSLKKAIELQPDLAAEAEKDPDFQRLRSIRISVPLRGKDRPETTETTNMSSPI
jgi:tetratricopeptide (TPR) repeat protein